MRLSDYPYVRVRIACKYCRRRGSYRLARLAARFGPEMSLDELVQRLAADCPHVDDRRGGCGARLIDLAGPPRPPDLPPAMRAFKVVPGGKE